MPILPRRPDVLVAGALSLTVARPACIQNPSESPAAVAELQRSRELTSESRRAPASASAAPAPGPLAPSATPGSLFSAFEAGLSGEWRAMERGWPINHCIMQAAAVEPARPGLLVTVSRLPSGGDRPYRCGGIYSHRRFRPGAFTARLQVAAASGTVTSFYLMSPRTAPSWRYEEIAIQFLGRSRRVELAVRSTASGTTADRVRRRVVELPFDPAVGFHDYTMLWRPARIAWLADGRELHADTTLQPATHQVQVRLNHWVPRQGVTGVPALVGAPPPGPLTSRVAVREIHVEPDRPDAGY